MRRAAKVDGNQAAIVEVLRRVGCSVQPLSAVGFGVPDLLVGYQGQNWLLEVKDRDGRGEKLTPLQERWHAQWEGQVAVVCCAADALDVILGDDPTPPEPSQSADAAASPPDPSRPSRPSE